MLNDSEATSEARRLFARLMAGRTQLDVVRRYWTGRMGLPLVVGRDVPREVKEMARVATGINIAGTVVEALEQSLFVDGFRGPRQSTDLDVWATWQANALDAHQGAIHRPALAYGTSYAIVWPGALLPEDLRINNDPKIPVIHGTSPRLMSAEYDRRRPTWPTIALESVGGGEYWMYDKEAIYTLARDEDTFQLVDAKEHGLGVTPVIRYAEVDDPDADEEAAEETQFTRWRPLPRLVAGQVAPLMPLQDQIGLVTFNLLVAQHYCAFRQRYIIGWVAADENNVVKLAASRLQLWTDAPDNVKVGELSETDLSGYIEAREASLKYAATLSQTPVHELIGELVNLSAEALAAAEAGRDRKVDEHKTMFGESHEQMLRLVGEIAGTDVPFDAQVVWRDTTARAFAAIIDALGKLVHDARDPCRGALGAGAGRDPAGHRALEGEGGGGRCLLEPHRPPAAPVGRHGHRRRQWERTAGGRQWSCGMSAERRYRKIEPIFAQLATADGAIATPEGVMEYRAGDYIATDARRTHSWPIRRDVFEQTYVEDDDSFAPE